MADNETWNTILNEQVNASQNVSSLIDSNVSIVVDVVPIWMLPKAIEVLSIVYLSCVTFVALISNVLLMVVIFYSPSLKTPPNSHLLNICVNNLLLSLCMALSLASVFSSDPSSTSVEVLSGLQLFLSMNALLQYWGSFAAIGFYRYKTVRIPSLSLRLRRRIIKRSIISLWTISAVLCLFLTLAFVEGNGLHHPISNPFRTSFILDVDAFAYNPEQTTMVIIIVLAVVTGFILLLGSYYRVFKTLNFTGTLSKNRVTPWHRAPSLGSETTDTVLPTKRSYLPTDSRWTRPFIISESSHDSFIVHYQKNDQFLVIEDILALENPIRASAIAAGKARAKKPLRSTLSTSSTMSTRSRCPEFSDISLGADLQRFQKIKNTSAFRNQTLRKDRISLSGATKNSLVMISAYLVCSLPFLIVSLPAVLSSLPEGGRVITLIFCRLLFYLNAPVYPIWYLLFSKRVKKCLYRVFDSILIRFNVRR